jgi:hypothetical protein
LKKFIAIGDIHGRSVWKNIKPDSYEKIVFVGDYVDGYVSDAEVVENLQNIIDFKRSFPDKVVLLIGNHDLQYFLWDVFNPYECSGFNSFLQPVLTDMFRANSDLFQIAYQIDNFLFTHAGVSQGWYNYCKEIIEEYRIRFETENLAETLNVIFRSKDTKILHLVGTIRGGDYEFGGITWADKRETMHDSLSGYHQIVGHSRVPYIDTFVKDNASKITYIDVLSTREEFFEYPVTFDF